MLHHHSREHAVRVVSSSPGPYALRPVPAENKRAEPDTRTVRTYERHSFHQLTVHASPLNR
eukprot:scaffold587973_cov15-Prasinocladus_malaysianus.AAC.1